MFAKWLDIARKYQGVLIGSAYFGKRNPKDIDILLAVPEHEIPHIETNLQRFGFARNIVDPETCDKRIASSFSMDCWDIQIATPAIYRARCKAMRRIKKHQLHVGLDKRQLYELYDQMYDYV